MKDMEVQENKESRGEGEIEGKGDRKERMTGRGRKERIKDKG